MATKKTPAKKAAPAPKKAIPAKKAAPAPAKKVAPVKKAAPAPAKKAAPAPAKKAAPAPAKKAAPAPAKKAAPAPVKKAAPAPAKKAAPAPAKKVAPAPAKKAVPTPVKKAAPAPAKKAAPAPAKKAEQIKEKKVAPVPVKKEKPAKAEAPKKEKAPKIEKAPKKEKAPAKKPIRNVLTRQEPKRPELDPKNLVITPKKSIAEKFPESANTVLAHRAMSELKRRDKDKSPETVAINVNTNRSLLDVEEDDKTPRFRYSDEKLQEFRNVITKKLDLARKELGFLQGLITRKDESGTEDTENKFASMEDGSASQDREMMNQLAGRQITLIEKLEQAMVRIENKTYGICRKTGKLIEENRLKAVPHATLSMEAKASR